MPSDSPPRFVRRDLLRPLHVVEQELVVGFESGRGAEADLATGAAREFDSEERVEDENHLAVRQSEARVEVDGRGLSVRAELTGGGSERVRRLQFVATLNGLAAGDAAAEVDGELAVDRGAGNFGLELFGGAGFDDRSTAVRAGVREIRVVALVNLVGGRRRSVAVGAVLVAGFAAGRFGLGFGRTFAEQRGLTLPGAERVVELPAQFGVLAFGCGDSLSEFAANGTRGYVHNPILPTRGGFSCASLGMGR